MSVQLLDKTRKINKLLHNNHSTKVVFNDICEVLMETLSSNILVISKKGKVLGISLCPGVEEITELIEDKVGGYVDAALNERLLGVLSTKENVNLQTLGFERPGVERYRIKGLIINKFRGDKTILDPGVVMLEEKTHIPVVGVAPYLHIEVEDEDSLTERFTKKEEIGLIDLAVIRLPRISNFTDFNPFERIEGVSLRYVSSVSELKNPDMILLPGTKNTMEDLLWMRQNGLEAAVLKAAAAGKVIFGVCGGFQMLGDTLSDPLHVEAGGTIKGMGLLPMDTVFAGEKTRTRAEGAFGKTEGVLAGIEGTRIEAHERQRLPLQPGACPSECLRYH